MRIDLGAIAQAIFRRIGLDVQRNSLLWQGNAEFEELLRLVERKTLVTRDRCFTLYQLCRAAAIEGHAIAEVGVYKGGTAKLLAKTCPNTELHLFDTFCGLPDGIAGVDLLPAGDFGDTSEMAVRRFLGDCPNVVFHVGVFPQSGYAVTDRRFSFVHVDADLYASVRDCLEFFYPRLNIGGIIVVDDWDWKQCPGVRKAVEEFLHDKVEKPIIVRRYQCLLLKR